MGKSKKYMIFEAAISVGIILSVAFSGILEFKHGCDGIRTKVLRLHVIAASDSEEDQRVKLLVRDAVLEESEDIFKTSRTSLEAENAAVERTAELTERANRVLSENNMSYKARIEIGDSRFPTKTYGSITLPAGQYRAVRVILGAGEGHNWWCVMFPPLCVPAAEGERPEDVLGGEGMIIASAEPKYEIRFKIVEWYEYIKGKIEERIQ